MAKKTRNEILNEFRVRELGEANHSGLIKIGNFKTFAEAHRFKMRVKEGEVVGYKIPDHLERDNAVIQPEPCVGENAAELNKKTENQGKIHLLVEKVQQPALATTLK